MPFLGNFGTLDTFYIIPEFQKGMFEKNKRIHASKKRTYSGDVNSVCRSIQNIHEDTTVRAIFVYMINDNKNL